MIRNVSCDDKTIYFRSQGGWITKISHKVKTSHTFVCHFYKCMLSWILYRKTLNKFHTGYRYDVSVARQKADGGFSIMEQNLIVLTGRKRLGICMRFRLWKGRARRFITAGSFKIFANCWKTFFEHWFFLQSLENKSFFCPITNKT